MGVMILAPHRQPKFAALGGGQHHHSHNALCIHFLFGDFPGPIFGHAQPDHAVESAGQLHQFGRRPGVQAEFVDHLDALRHALIGDHFDNSRWRTCTLTSPPANRARSSSATYTERWQPPVQPMATVK